jgi:hypothetical protein
MFWWLRENCTKMQSMQKDIHFCLGHTEIKLRLSRQNAKGHSYHFIHAFNLSNEAIVKIYVYIACPAPT